MNTISTPKIYSYEYSLMTYMSTPILTSLTPRLAPTPMMTPR